MEKKNYEVYYMHKVRYKRTKDSDMQMALFTDVHEACYLEEMLVKEKVFYVSRNRWTWETHIEA
jgi:hypothetical protein